MAKIVLFLFGVVLLSSMVDGYNYGCHDIGGNCLHWKRTWADFESQCAYEPVKSQCKKTCGNCRELWGQSQEGDGRTCAYFFNNENARGRTTLQVLSGTKENGEEIGTSDRPDGYRTNMKVDNWVNNYDVDGWAVKAVKVWKGCTLQAFGNDLFIGELGVLEGPKRGEFQEYVNGDFHWAKKMQSWKCQCNPHK